MERKRTRAVKTAAAMCAAVFLLLLLAPAREALGMGPGPMAAAAKQAGAKDPVTGKKVKAKDAPVLVFLDAAYKFESAETMEKFRAAPEQYATTTCPVSTEPVTVKDAKVKTVHEGRTWYFCCADCKAKFEKDPAAYVTYRCPSCGGIAPVSIPGSVKAKIGGTEMRFCCESCKVKAEAEAEAFLSILVPEGGGPWRRPEPQP